MRILITGCSTGFGRATSIEATRRGHEVVATARDITTLTDLDVAQRLVLDVTDQASIDSAMAEAGTVDALVNNAGVDRHGPVEAYPEDVARWIMDTNFWGTFRMTCAVAPAMREQGSGVIVNMSSVQGRVGTPLGGIYSASKAAIESYSESAHFELGHFGIRLVIMQPGYFDTPMAAKGSNELVDGTEYEALAEQWSSGSDSLNPAGRPGPEPVATAIVDAIENGETPLRVPVGDDAHLVLGARSAMDDSEFEDVMRSTLNLYW
ncbi:MULTISPECIES: SDR family oxidoreductase [Candidatus Microthrix]|jgi:NAD(P)-dependent dehydrogenase (short-subunit alcohol dehydrogenase family)|uniref:SDR family oxidoreductase n=1 Tax=Candidatus Neomicrothrix TaxID=41949 RepID=UPI000374724F|nr:MULTISPECIES: SDR family oxidoreductase [Microthrix]NLH65660.1 SDR family oxidoreductase [Candidatus Microthrix parvicella]MBK6501608.1 SDR family oxidoreductase [Candidatus Microthrix sp.]MBK7019108.1 SDR family oxidoreductase [Candidatus Microthrix sp.]MBK7321111.1 SDR family oxidoreductase [Candidatus Microthrix sp.]MBL0203477.1 SDR family oxidoreductase [Candidatus Microthrix sp.]